MVIDNDCMRSLVRFVRKNPSAQQIIDYKASVAESERYEYLLAKYMNEELMDQERLEFKFIQEVNDILFELKLDANMELNGK